MRVSSPARALTRYVTRYRLRYAAGVACLGAATLLSLAIPRTVQRAVEALEADAGGAPVGAYVGIILLLALGNGVARLGSRFAMMGSAQRVEYDVRNHERTQAAQDQLGVLSARVQEHLAAMSVVRAYTMEGQAAAEFDRANGEYLRRSLALGRTLSQFVPLTGLITGLGALIVLWLGGRAVMDGRLTLGALVAFNGYLAYLAWPTLALGFTLSIVRRGLTSMERIQEIVATAPAPEPHAAPLGGAPAIRFSNLTFAYEDRPPALREVSFEVTPGETVAVVGHTGSGKSTLGALLARLWEPPPGTVFLDGRDVRTLPLRALRGTIGYVPQEAFLFSRSVSDNVSLEREALDA